MKMFVYMLDLKDESVIERYETRHANIDPGGSGEAEISGSSPEPGMPVGYKTRQYIDRKRRLCCGRISSYVVRSGL